MQSWFLKKTLSVVIIVGLVACTPPTKKVSAPAPATANNQRFTGLPILQGYTDESTAQFSILHKKNQKPHFFIRSFEELTNFTPKPIHVKRTVMPHSSWAISRLKVSQLKKGKSYRLEVWSKNKFKMLDLREFKTLDLTQNRVKILMAGCFKLNRAYQQTQMWSEALSHSPDIILLNGDAVYANRTSSGGTNTNPESIWDAYVNWRQNMSFFYRHQLIPTLATWDDGDFGRIDGNRNFQFKAISESIFHSFFPQVADGQNLVKGPGVSKLLRGFGLDIFLLDARSFRSPKGQSAQTQWGQRQEQWLLTNLNQSLRPSFLIQGDQFFGGHHPFESYEGERPLSFLNLMERIKKLPKPVAFFSGDRHLTELMKLKAPEWPYSSFEFTTSALHAQTYKGTLKKYPNPRNLYAVDGVQNYGIIDVKTIGPSSQIRIRAWGPNHLKLYEHSLRLNR